MELVTLEEFSSRTLGGWPVAADVSVYAGKLFECACGQSHPFSGKKSDVLRELPGMRFVLNCPLTHSVTCVSITGLVNIKIVSEFGCRTVENKRTRNEGAENQRTNGKVKNLYAVLGVLPTAEAVVIRAAYKALAQRYHPDKYPGPKHEAEALMTALNEAYETLSDPERRRQYDEKFKDNSIYGSEADTSGEDSLNEAISALEEDWRVACKFYPDLESLHCRLVRTNSTLASMFKVLLLESKAYQDRVQLAAQMEYRFLERFFGSDTAIIGFAKELIAAGNKSAARALNNYLKVMGSGVPPISIIKKVREEFHIPDPWVEAKKRADAEAQEWANRERIAQEEKNRKRRENREQKAQEEIQAPYDSSDARALPNIERRGLGIFSPVYIFLALIFVVFILVLASEKKGAITTPPVASVADSPPNIGTGGLSSQGGTEQTQSIQPKSPDTPREWSLVHTTPDGVYLYIDSNRNKKATTVLALTVINTPGSTVSSSIAHELEYDCGSRRGRLRSTTAYAGYMGQGAIVPLDEIKPSGEWKSVSTAGEDWLKIICKAR